MTASLRLGRIFGIEIGLNWSLLIVAAYVAWQLAVEVFPFEVPGYAGTSYLIAALVAVVLFYGSLLAHELGHAVVGRRLGARVDGITLWLFGGVARLSGEAMSATAELQMTLVGPAITIVVAIFFGFVAAGLMTLNVFPLLADVFAWLARINLFLAAFNLIPAFPLDGGRVLRSIVWRATHNLQRATAIAAFLGRAFGVLMIVGGLWWIVQTRDFITGAWVGFLGWFLFQAAGSQEFQTELQESLAGLTAGDVMEANPVTAPDWMTVDNFVAQVASVNRAQVYPVRDFSGQLTGLVSLRDLSIVPENARSSTQLRAIARPLTRVPTVRPDDALVDVLRNLDGSDGGYALVMDAGRLVGVISPPDVSRALELARRRSSGMNLNGQPAKNQLP